MFRVVEITSSLLFGTGVFLVIHFDLTFAMMFLFWAFALNWAIGGRWYFTRKRENPGKLQKALGIVLGLIVSIVYFITPIELFSYPSPHQTTFYIAFGFAIILLLINFTTSPAARRMSFVNVLKAMVLLAPMAWLVLSNPVESELNLKIRTALVASDVEATNGYQAIDESIKFENAAKQENWEDAYHHAKYAWFLQMSTTSWINEAAFGHVRQTVVNKPLRDFSQFTETFDSQMVFESYRHFDQYLTSCLYYAQSLSDQNSGKESIEAYAEALELSLIVFRSGYWDEQKYFTSIYAIISQVKPEQKRQALMALLLDKHISYLQKLEANAAKRSFKRKTVTLFEKLSIESDSLLNRLRP